MVGQLCGCVVEGSEKAKWPLPGLWSFVWKEAIPRHLPYAGHLSFSLYALVPFKLLLGAAAHRE